MNKLKPAGAARDFRARPRLTHRAKKDARRPNLNVANPAVICYPNITLL